MALQEAECEVAPLLEGVLHSLHVVRPCDTVATKALWTMWFNTTEKETRFDNSERGRERKRHEKKSVSIELPG